MDEEEKETMMLAGWLGDKVNKNENVKRERMKMDHKEGKKYGQKRPGGEEEEGGDG